MLNKDDAWGNAVTELFDYAEEKQQYLWSYFFERINQLTPRSFRKQVLPIIEKIGEKDFRKVLHKWLEIVILEKPKTQFYEDESGLEYERNYLLEYPNESLFGKTIRTLPFVADKNSVILLQELAIEAGKNRTGVGIASYKLSEMAIYALADCHSDKENQKTEKEKLNAVSALLSVQVQLRSTSLKKLIEKKLTQVAKSKKMALIELLEYHLPDFGLENGFLEGEINHKEKYYAYQIEVKENRVKLTWFDYTGKTLKTTPSFLKKNLAGKVEKLKGTVSEAQKTLTLQRERLERAYLTQKTFTYAHWRNVYAQHGLLGVVIENLVWQVYQNGAWKSVWSSFGRLIDIQKKPVEVSDATIIRLWHPVFSESEEIDFWQEFIKKRTLKQPFQQVFRNFYTRQENEVEESNRFVGVVLNQKKLRAFAKIQGWNYKYLNYPKMEKSFATFQLDYLSKEEKKPQKIEVEFWVEAIPSQKQNVRTSTVKLSRKGNELSLEILDEVIFSEIFRAVQRIISVSEVD